MRAAVRNGLWAAWGLATVALVLYLAARLAGGERTPFLPGHTTSGHYQIELACSACHVSAFAGAGSMQSACEGCHLAMESADSAAHYPAASLCARCHDGVDAPRVTWAGPAQVLTNLRFDHEVHARAVAGAR